MTDGEIKKQLEPLLEQLTNRMVPGATISELQKNPFFWDTGKSGKFLQGVSSVLKNTAIKTKYIRNDLKSKSNIICGGDWKKKTKRSS